MYVLYICDGYICIYIYDTYTNTTCVYGIYLADRYILILIYFSYTSTTGMSGTSRLLYLYSPECDAHWQVQITRASDFKTNHSISLKYKVTAESLLDTSFSQPTTIDDTTSVTTSAPVVWRHHPYNDLLDFQSNIILEKSVITSGHNSDLSGVENENESKKDEDIIMDTFLIQFNNIRKLNDIMCKLYLSGHFDYISQHIYTIPLSESISVYEKKCIQYEEERISWEKYVIDIREKYYYINYYDLKRCYSLIHYLLQLTDPGAGAGVGEYIRCIEDKVQGSIAASFVTDPLINALALLNVDGLRVMMGASDAALSHLLGRLIQTWVELAASAVPVSTGTRVESGLARDTASYKHYLPTLAEALESVLVTIPLPSRVLTLLGIDQYVATDVITAGIYTALCPSLKSQYDQLITLCAIQQTLTSSDTCLLCTATTPFEQVALFLYRWANALQFSSLPQTSKLTFYTIEVEKLSYDVQYATIHLLRDLTDKKPAVSPLILVGDSNEPSYLTSQYINHRLTSGILPQSRLLDATDAMTVYGIKTYCYTSKIAGTGKSFAIRYRAAEEGRLYVHIPVNSPTMSPDQLVQRVQENIKRSVTEIGATVFGTVDSSKVLLHLDLSSTVTSSIINSLFSMCTLGLLFDPHSEVAYFPVQRDVCICIELATGLQYGSLTPLALYHTIDITVSAESFAFSGEGLLKGMRAEYHAQLYGVVAAPTGQATPRDEYQFESTAYDRLYCVVMVLYLLKLNHGSFPHDFSIEHNTQQSHDLQAPLPFSSHEAFDLLLDASALQAHPSLWCLWSFINVVYWQILEIHKHKSPIYLACLPDNEPQLMTRAFDTAMKERVKGEMVYFILNTARNFATRQTSKKPEYDPDRPVGLLVKDLSWVSATKTPDINLLFWKRERYDNDAHPVYKSPPLAKTQAQPNQPAAVPEDPNRQFHLFIHYRESESRWVIDDTVNYTGGVIAYSTSGEELNDALFEQRVLRGRDVQTTVKIIKHNDGYKKEAVTIDGFQNCAQGSGSVAGPDDNGLYLRVSDDINGKAHYVKTTPERHLYYLATDKGRWVIAKTCNAEVMGASAYTRGNALDSKTFVYYPPNVPERNAKIKVIRAKDAVEVISREAQRLAANHDLDVTTLLGDNATYCQAAPTPVGNGLPSSSSTAKTAAPAIPSVEMIEATLEREGLNLELARWKDSNHECIIFNNNSGIVKFLSLDSSVLRNMMHPVLLKHLESNYIHVGDDSLVTSDVDRYWDILSITTGVNRTREEAGKV